MESNRSVWISAVLFLVLRKLSSATPLSGFDNKTEINCYNDYEELMFCQLDFASISDGSNCTEFRLDVSSEDIESHCVFKQCPSGICCCSVSGMSETFILGYSHTAKLWKGTKHVQSKVISIENNIKPKAPTIISVNKSNFSENYVVTWKINSIKYSFSDHLLVKVIWHKKGEMKEEYEIISPKSKGEINEYEILSQLLEPSTTYVVSMKSYTNLSNIYSDSSQELEFITSVSSLVIMLAVIISLSVAAVIITSVVFGCYIKFKAKWWDTVAKCPNPTLLNMNPSEEKLLKPSQTSFSTIRVDPPILTDGKAWSKISLIDSSSGSQQQSSGISAGSSCLSYTNTEPAGIIINIQEALSKAFPHLAMMSSMPALPTASNTDSCLLSAPYNPCTLRADDFWSSPGSPGFDNKTYSILIPSCEKQPQIQSVMPCVLAYLPSKGDMLSNTQLDQQVPACLVIKRRADSPPAILSLMQTDFSYQQCNAASGSFSHPEDTGLSSVCGDIDTPAPCDLVSKGEAGCENCADVVKGATQLHDSDKDVYGEGATISQNPCYGCLPESVPPVENEYQAFQSLVKQPGILFAEQNTDDRGECLDKYSKESFTRTPQNLLHPVLPNFFSFAQGQCLPEAERPF
ncbi:hypothetical protein LDENG_00236410 [Lucifuga dentata]|nr:hypothetical protein LDENG_00236410 [Lucifuga dentata]